MLVGLELVDKHLDVSVKTSWLLASQSKFNKGLIKDTVSDPRPVVGAERRCGQVVAVEPVDLLRVVHPAIAHRGGVGHTGVRQDDLVAARQSRFVLL